MEVSVIVAGGPAPVNPTPGPGPTPVPGPVSTPIADGHLWLMTVLPDFTAQTPVQGAIRADAAIQAELDKKSNKFRWIDVNAPTEYAPWVTAAKAIGLPAACIVDDRDAAGTIRDSLPLATATAADVAVLVKKWSTP